MFTRTWIRTGAALVALGLPLTAVTDSFGADNKYYHGTECVGRGSKPNVRYGVAGIVNDESDYRSIVCPVVRDVRGSDVSDWDVTVDRNGSTRDWTISLFSCDRGGEAAHCFSSTRIVGTGDHVDGAAVSNFLDNGIIYILSDVPPGANIRSYHVGESAGTD